MSTGHSVVAPSGAAQRIQCAQSTTLQAQFPEQEDSAAAAEGTAAHWAVAEQLSGRLIDVGVVAPNGVVLDEEMCRAADQVLDYVTRILAPHGLKPSDGHVEERVDIPRVHPLAWGTPDYWVRFPNGLFFLLDFKYGHRVVEVAGNPQLVEYVAGITNGVRDIDHVPIMAVIAQPRAFHRDGTIREWHTDLLSMRALINVASNAAHEALGPNPRAQVGPECRDCRARHACPALQAAAYGAMDEARHVTPLELPPASLAIELRLAASALKLLEARVSGLKAQATAAIDAGARVPGWALEQSAGREKWKVPPAQVIAMGQMFSLDLAKPAEPVTPKQARDKGLNPDLVKQLAERQRGATTLVESGPNEGARLFKPCSA